MSILKILNRNFLLVGSLTFILFSFTTRQSNVNAYPQLSDPVVAYITVNGVEYSLHGQSASSGTVTRITWSSGDTGDGEFGFFYVQDLQRANVQFVGANNASISYNNVTYQ